MTEVYDWKVALLVVAGACVVFTLTLEAFRAKFDKDRDESKKIHLSDFRGTLTLVLSQKSLRSLAFGCFAFVGLQTTFVAFFVIYLTDIGYGLIEAGAIFQLQLLLLFQAEFFGAG